MFYSLADCVDEIIQVVASVGDEKMLMLKKKKPHSCTILVLMLLFSSKQFIMPSPFS